MSSSFPSDQKEPFIDDMADHEKQFDGLRVGQPTLASRVRERWAGMGKAKKCLIAALAFFALVHLVSGFAHHVHKMGHRGRHAHHFGPEHGHVNDDHENWTPSEYTWNVDMDDAIIGTLTVEPGFDPEYTIANATFDTSSFKSGHHRHHKALAIDLPEGADAQLIVSKEDVDLPTLIIESIWKDEAPVSRLAMSRHQDTLVIDSADAAHAIHLVLPQDARRVPPLFLRSPSGLPIILHSSVQGDKQVVFKHVELVSQSDIVMEDNLVAKDVRMFTSNGTITGSYNVSRALILTTVSGDIKANVTVFPSFPHHGPGNEHAPHRPHHNGPAHPDADEDEGHEHRRHQYRGRHHKRQGCKKGSFLARLFGIRQGPKHPDHPPHGPPTPPYIGLTSVDGDLTLYVEAHRYPTHIGVVLNTVTTNGDIFAHVSEFFRGFFKAKTSDGHLNIGASGNKTTEILKEVINDEGTLIEGLVHLNHKDVPPKHKHHGHGGKGKKDNTHTHKKEKKRDEDESDDDNSEPEERWEGEEEPFPSPPEDDSERPRPPHRDSPGPPPPPPHKGPGGPSPPPPPPHKGPGGPPPPHGPHGHPHHPPPACVVTAETKVGDIKLEL